ncbi:MAG: hypothetical protein ABI167_03030 [Nitrosospira sp.]
MVRKCFDSEQLVQVRALPLIGILDRLKEEGVLFWRRDVDFVPEKDSRTMRLFISVPSGFAWELLLTDSKWFDTRAGKGGGGGIDLVMYLLGLDFVIAVTLLLQYVDMAGQAR